MDIFEFINSEAIGSYLKSIDYKFDSLKMAFIVWQDKTHTLKQKHLAYEYIISRMNDYIITDKAWIYGTLHQMLTRYMEVENKIISAFMKREKNSVYSYEEVYEDMSTHKNERVFSDYEDIKNHFTQYEECRVCYYEITKKWTDGVRNGHISVKFSSDGEILQISEKNCSFIGDSHILSAFEGMWFYFPTPFEKGDIVYVKNKGYACSDINPFVLDGICYDVWDGKTAEIKEEYGNASDMIAFGYFQDENGEICMDCMNDYMSLEYYPQKLTGKQRILKVISNYLNAKIDIVLLLNSYHTILLEEKIKKKIKGLGLSEEDLQFNVLSVQNIKP